MNTGKNAVETDEQERNVMKINTEETYLWGPIILTLTETSMYGNLAGNG